MELISINPHNLWGEMYKQPRVMSLTHLFDRYPDTYGKLALEHPETYKIQDNSIIEMGNTFKIDHMVEVADKYHTQELILPDGFPRGDDTCKLVEEALNWMVQHNRIGDYKLMGVCHGVDYNDFTSTFNYLNSIKEIDVLGIPKVLQRWLPSKNRAELAHIFTKTDKEIHFLGEWFSLRNLIEMPSELKNRVRSCDTCLPCLTIVENKTIFEDRDGTIDLEKDYPEITLEKYNQVLNKYTELDRG